MSLHSTNPVDPRPAIVRTAIVDLYKLAERIRQEHATSEQWFKKGLERAKLAGELLLTAKEEINRKKDKKWKDWVKDCTGLPLRTASRYMLIAREWDRVENAESLRDALRILTEENTPENLPPDESLVGHVADKDLEREEILQTEYETEQDDTEPIDDSPVDTKPLKNRRQNDDKPKDKNTEDIREALETTAREIETFANMTLTVVQHRQRLVALVKELRRKIDKVRG